MAKKFIILGVILGVLAAGLMWWRINQIENKQKALSFFKLKPEISVAKGQTISPEMLHTFYLPEKFGSLNDIVIQNTQTNLEWIKTYPVTTDIAAGRFLLYEYFEDKPETRFAAKIEDGKRAITIGVSPTTAVGFFIEPGSRVDILGTIETQEIKNIEVEIPFKDKKTRKQKPVMIPQISKKIVTKTILQNVRILAVGRITTRRGYTRSGGIGYSNVTVELSPFEAEKLVFAMGQIQGGFTLLLRNPKNNTQENIPSVSWKDIQ